MSLTRACPVSTVDWVNRSTGAHGPTGQLPWGWGWPATSVGHVGVAPASRAGVDWIGWARRGARGRGEAHRGSSPEGGGRVGAARSGRRAASGRRGRGGGLGAASGVGAAGSCATGSGDGDGRRRRQILAA